MGANSLPKTITRQRRDCDLNPGPSAPESSTLTTQLTSYPSMTSNNRVIDQQMTKRPWKQKGTQHTRDKRVSIQRCLVLHFRFCIFNTPEVRHRRVKHTDIAVRSLTCHTATGTHVPYRITQCYLPPGRGDIRVLTPAEAGARFSDPGGMQG